MHRSLALVLGVMAAGCGHGDKPVPVQPPPFRTKPDHIKLTGQDWTNGVVWGDESQGYARVIQSFEEEVQFTLMDEDNHPVTQPYPFTIMVWTNGVPTFPDVFACTTNAELPCDPGMGRVNGAQYPGLFKVLMQSSLADGNGVMHIALASSRQGALAFGAVLPRYDSRMQLKPIWLMVRVKDGKRVIYGGGRWGCPTVHFDPANITGTIGASEITPSMAQSMWEQHEPAPPQHLQLAGSQYPWPAFSYCIPFVDADRDTVADGGDACPTDPNKLLAGSCGCGVSDRDWDGDSIPDCHDPYPLVPFPSGVWFDADGDRDVDMDDFAILQRCVGEADIYDSQSYPLYLMPAGCRRYDINQDRTIDAADVAVFAQHRTGPGVPGT